MAINRPIVLTYNERINKPNRDNILKANEDKSMKDSLKRYRNFIFIEALGNGLIGSVNYQLSRNIKKEWWASIRVGGLYLESDRLQSPKKNFNTEISLSYGKRNSIGSGVGVSFFSGAWACKECDTSYVSETLFILIKPVEVKHISKSGLFFSSSFLIVINAQEYNNYVKTHKKQLFINPVIPLIGLSIGYCFK
ncbi:MAG: hypothetical protein K0Q95_964 [Bacteroidota bacterium]|nr:hypothetical protein [Bacteroidota bacterium]